MLARIASSFSCFPHFLKTSSESVDFTEFIFEMGVAGVFLGMFLRKLKNRSGSISVQIISKERGKYKVVKTIGSSNNEQEIQKLTFLAKQEIERLSTQPKLFVSESDTMIERAFELLANASIKTVGPEIIFGKIYVSISGCNA
jgi:hypothetical protein